MIKKQNVLLILSVKNFNYKNNHLTSHSRFFSFRNGFCIQYISSPSFFLYATDGRFNIVHKNGFSL